MADDWVGGLIKGGEATKLELDRIQRDVDKATKKALKSVQALTKRSIKGGMRGRPRWDHRGASSRTGEAVNLDLNPHVAKKTGGPGKFTGSLSGSIRASKRPRKKGIGNYSGVVMAGGKGGPQNIYKGKVEGTYPYFKPGVKKAEPKMPAVWEIAWAKATKTKK
ncbi:MULTISPECIES: hypothetical protein [unclassified Kitasatospora]|uniref:hypothetical protein n=1 Tax=unclassified Kitasatospora TaxID=2633591 RepID=UPI00247413B9|nr:MULTISPECIES: hypothetical protein [unclassified Kitasatospora]MDH6123859.1 hypothetical protein [Kitasatospora sp. GP82]MDH6576042.1 hypothetical protein [Kitasatospora sp. MAP5-34]